MERVSRDVVIWVVCLASFGMARAWAGTSYVAVEGGDIETEFPPSEFGKEPASLNLKQVPHFARDQSEDIDREGKDGAEGDASRRPAGLEFSSDAVSGNTKRPRAAARSPSQTIQQEGSPENTPASAPAHSKLPISALRGAVQEVALIAGDLGFFPKTFFVSRDVPVRLYVTGASRNTLCIMMDSFAVKKQVRSNRIEEISFTPSNPGRYRFYCPVNGMEGMMIVKELTTVTDSDEGSRLSPMPKEHALRDTRYNEYNGYGKSADIRGPASDRTHEQY